MTLLAQMNSMIAKLHILKTVLFSEDNFPSQKQHKLIVLTQTIKTQHWQVPRFIEKMDNTYFYN